MCQEASAPTGFNHVGLVPNFGDCIYRDEKSQFNTRGRNCSFYLFCALTSSETLRMAFVLPELQSSLGPEFISGPAEGQWGSVGFQGSGLTAESGLRNRHK